MILTLITIVFVSKQAIAYPRNASRLGEEGHDRGPLSTVNSLSGLGEILPFISPKISTLSLTSPVVSDSLTFREVGVTFSLVYRNLLRSDRRSCTSKRRQMSSCTEKRHSLNSNKIISPMYIVTQPSETTSPEKILHPFIRVQVVLPVSNSILCWCIGSPVLRTGSGEV
jgi:hypothetical protein